MKVPPAEEPVAEPPTGGLGMKHAYARHDPAHCTIPGLFQSFKKGQRNRRHEVVHKYGEVTLNIKCFDALGADDLRVLQGLVAIAAPVGGAKILGATPEPDAVALRNSIQLSESARDLKTVHIQDTYYQLAKVIGLDHKSGTTYPRLRNSIERLSSVSITATYKNGVRHGYQLLGGFTADDNKKLLNVALNPRLTSAILGKPHGGNGSHTRIEMLEVQTMKGDAPRILHQYLCACLSPGQTKEFDDRNLCKFVWFHPSPPGRKTAAEIKKQENNKRKEKQRMQAAMQELANLGWTCEITIDTRKTTIEKALRRWRIKRPSTKKVDAVIVDDTTKTPVLEAASEEKTLLQTPARALRDHADALNPQQFAVAVSKQPTAALRYCSVRLTPDQFSQAVAAAPEAALRYVPEKLTRIQLRTSALAKPLVALQHVLNDLDPKTFVDVVTKTNWAGGDPSVTDSQLDSWFSTDALSALQHLSQILGEDLSEFQKLTSILSPSRLDSCALAMPEDALREAHLLPNALVADLALAHPAHALQVAMAELDEETRDYCILRAPTAAIKFCFNSLSPEQRKYCIGKSPWVALDLHKSTLSPAEIEEVSNKLGTLSAAQIEIIVNEAPRLACQYLSPIITSDQRARCEISLGHRSS